MPAKHRRRPLRGLAVPALVVAGLIAAGSATAVNVAGAHGGGGWHHAARPDSQPAGLGTLTGVRTLNGPVQAAPGTWVVFTVNGPRRLVRTDVVAPFQLTLDTRRLPDGPYALTVLVLAPNRPAVATTRAFRILNHPAPPGPTATTPAPGTRPAHAPTAPAPSRPTTARPAPPDFVSQVIALTNAERAKNGCGALHARPLLTAVAQAHSTDMARNDYFSHDTQTGTSPFQRMTAAGYPFATAGENIAAGQRTPATVMTAWMNSPEHRANIVNCAFTEIGVGYATSAGSRYLTYWTQDFGAPR